MKTTYRPSLVVAISIVIVAFYSVSQASESKGKPKRFRNDIDKFKQADTAKMPPKGATLFVGSSSIRMWHQRLAEDFPDRDVIPRGFGGSTMELLLHYFDEIVTPYQPAIIVVYEGDNDLAGNRKVEDVAKQFDEFVERVNEHVPGAAIVFIPPKPSVSRWKLWPKMEKLNSYLQQLAAQRKNVWYADIASPMLEQSKEPGQPPSKDLFVKDGLHLSGQGYDLWTKVVQDVLKDIEVQSP
jgi:lysophospholipase L1-like esterase